MSAALIAILRCASSQLSTALPKPAKAISRRCRGTLVNCDCASATTASVSPKNHRIFSSSTRQDTDPRPTAEPIRHKKVVLLRPQRLPRFLTRSPLRATDPFLLLTLCRGREPVPLLPIVCQSCYLRITSKN